MKSKASKRLMRKEESEKLTVSQHNERKAVGEKMTAYWDSLNRQQNELNS